MRLAKLAEALIAVSAKAACIARAMRSEQALFELLVEEKIGDCRNKRFIQDFKTLGDVLVQETVRHDISKQFSELSEHIYGEESNTFTNTLGESVTMTIQPTEQQTCHLLAQVLDGNMEAARLLAEVVHSNVTTETYAELQSVTDDIVIDNLGIWIDPIDSTAQYISGHQGISEGGVYREGLECVVVIIGVYDRTTGYPILGVCNQPFFRQDTDTQQWTGRCIWGLSHGETHIYHVPDLMPVTNKTDSDPAGGLVTSSSEQQAVQDQLKSAGYTIRHAAGAGYKLLCVVDGLVMGYVLSAGSTFKWDTCGPHAILLAMGGDLLSLSAAREMLKGVSDTEHHSEKRIECRVRYDEPDPGERSLGEKWSNAGGLLAYRNPQQLHGIVQAMT